MNNATLANPTASPTVTTTYILVTANDTCAGTDTVTVFVNSLPVVSAGADLTICLLQSTTLNASGGTGYLWSPAAGLNNPAISNPIASPSLTTNYTVTVTDGNGCTNMDLVQVFVNPLPPASAGLNDTMCSGDSLVLNGSGGIIYSWSPSTGLSDPNISNPVTSVTSATDYTVTVTDANGCSNSDSVTIGIWQLPVILAFSDTSICSGGTAFLNSSGGISYVWSPATGLNNPNISNPIATPSSATTYIVTGTDGNGCRNTDSVIVSINIMPLADFGYTLSPACDGMKVKFLDSSLNATQWMWNLGNGSTSTLQNPITSFPYLGSYTVTLIAVRPPCEDTISQVISTGNFPDSVIVQIANVFTPNNDGINDCFRIKLNGEFAGCADLTIYNRWGVPVFHTSYSGACWDGTTDAGIAAAEGTYYYILDVKGILEKGFVTLLR